MRYRRALLLGEVGEAGEAGLHSALALVRRVAPGLEHLLIIVASPSPSWWGARTEPTPESEAGAAAALDAMRQATVGVAPTVDVQFAPMLGADAIAELCSAEDLDLLVLGSRSLLSAAVHRKRLPTAVSWTEREPGSGPVASLACVVLDDRSLVAIGALLRDHGDPAMRVALLVPAALATGIEPSFLAVSGIDARVEVSSPSEDRSITDWLGEQMRDQPVDLLVLVGSASASWLDARQGPVLLVPPLAANRSFLEPTIDVGDLVDEGGRVRVRIDQMATIGGLAPLADQAIAFVAGGRVVASTVTSSLGETEIPAEPDLMSLGIYRVREGESPDPLGAIEQLVSVIRPGPDPVRVFAAELPDEAIGEFTGACIAIRLRPNRSCAAIRERLRGLGLPAIVLDARTVLDEGEALDVSDAFDAVRLARVIAKLRRLGFAIEGTQGELEESSSPGNRIEIELDNPRARAWLHEAIETSVETLHLQVYAAADDEVGRAVEERLAEAGARGVAVRVLVDSLHGLHGSFGTRNALLERLSQRPGIELRVVCPILETPSLMALKQRDHRKLVIADNRVALVGGRNLASEYYTGFDEAKLTPESVWRDVPWLDSGARIEGPAVGVLASAFLEAWTEAGGSPFEVSSPPEVGSSTVRVVVHRGLRDAHGLETYRELIDGARSHVYVVNGFPLALELQHALVGALRRGVRVRTLIGRLTPTHGGTPFGGPWSTARTMATELVHSRMDPIVAAGGDCYLFAQAEAPGWTPGLGVVNPHVHAKAMSVDGLRCTVGSANLDITAAYWESELMLVVEDPTVVAEFEQRIDSLMTGSIPFDRNDPTWQQLAKRRGWMRHWPAVLSV